MIITQLLDALSAAHEVGVVHRDIKEANILYDATLRQIKLCDFGIARAVERLADQAKTTREGVIIGTEHYIAPERYQGRNHDLRSDLYSVGVIFYRLLTGHRPLERYAGEPLTPEMLIYRLFSEPIGGLDAVPTPIARVCERLLEVDATRRYQEASVAAQELAAALKAPAEIDHTGDSSSGSNAGFSAGSSSAPNSAFKALPLPGHIAPARALAPPLLDGEHAAQTQTARGLDARMSDGPQPWSVERRSLVRPLLFVMVGVLLMVCWTWYTGLKHDADIKTRGAGAIILKPKLTPKHTQSHTQSRTSRALRSTSGRKESAVGETSTRDRPRERSQETDRREIDRQTTRRRRLKRTPRRPQRGSRSRSSDESSPFIYPQAK